MFKTWKGPHEDRYRTYTLQFLNTVSGSGIHLQYGTVFVFFKIARIRNPIMDPVGSGSGGIVLYPERFIFEDLGYNFCKSKVNQGKSVKLKYKSGSRMTVSAVNWLWKYLQEATIDEEEFEGEEEELEN